MLRYRWTAIRCGRSWVSPELGVALGRKSTGSMAMTSSRGTSSSSHISHPFPREDAHEPRSLGQSQRYSSVGLTDWIGSISSAPSLRRSPPCRPATGAGRLPAPEAKQSAVDLTEPELPILAFDDHGHPVLELTQLAVCVCGRDDLPSGSSRPSCRRPAPSRRRSRERSPLLARRSTMASRGIAFGVAGDCQRQEAWRTDKRSAATPYAPAPTDRERVPCAKPPAR